MALLSVRSDLRNPTHDKTFTLPVAAAQSLHETSEGALQNHLPTTISLNVTTGGTCIFKDGSSAGNSNTITFAAGWYVLPFTASTIEVGTAVGTATVSWQPAS